MVAPRRSSGVRGGFDGRSKKALILRSSFCELFYSTLWYDAPPHTAGQAGSGTPVETPSPVAHHALRYGHGGHLDGCSGGPSRGAEIPGARACDQTAREKTDAALHPIHCVMVMAATWTDVSTGHRKGAEIRGTTACGQTAQEK